MRRFINPIFRKNRSKVGTFNDEIEDLYNLMIDNFKKEQLENVNKAKEEFDEIKSRGPLKSTYDDISNIHDTYANNVIKIVQKYRDKVLVPKLYGEHNYKLINDKLRSNKGLYKLGLEYDHQIWLLYFETRNQIKKLMPLVKPISSKRSLKSYPRAMPLEVLPTGVIRRDIPIVPVESVDTKRMDSSDGGIARLIRKRKTKKVKRKGRKSRKGRQRSRGRARSRG